MLTEAEAAWLACAIDSEGTIVLQVYQQAEIVTRISAYANITNTDARYLDHAEQLIRKVSGGCNRGVRHKGKYTVCPVQFVAVSSELRVRPLLETVLPHLIVKKVRAEALLTYFGERELARKQRRGSRGTAAYGEEVTRLYESFYSDDIRTNPRRKIGYGN